MGAGSFGGVSIAATSMAMRNTTRRIGGYGGGGRIPESLGEKKEVEVRSDRKGRFLLEPYITSGGYCFWNLYVEVETTAGWFRWKKNIKKWKYINDYAGTGPAMEAAKHYLTDPRVVEL